MRAQAVRLIDGLTGHTVMPMNLERDAADLEWRFIHRARLIEVLHEAAVAHDVMIDLGHRVAAPGDHDALPGDDLLIGADGIHSTLRGALNENAPPAAFTGQVAWRAVIKDDGGPVAEVHMGPGRHLVSYPLGGGLRNLVAVEERRQWAEADWHQKDDPENLRRAFASFTPRVRDWLEQVETVHLWGLFRHPVAERWYKGRQVILGDAAHPTLPFLAQGANMALEDAWTLADCLSDDLETSLASYQAKRHARSVRIVNAATRNARNYHLSFPPLRFGAHLALRIGSTLAPRAALRRFDWLYRYDVTA